MKYRGVPATLFDPINEKFHFTIDVCADEDNHKVDRYYDERIDGLAQSWKGEVVWCNPPYEDITKWIEKSWREADDAVTIVMLLPAMTASKWWQELIEFARVNRTIDVQFLGGWIVLETPVGLTAASLVVWQ